MFSAALAESAPGGSVNGRPPPRQPVYGGLSFRVGVQCSDLMLARYLDAVLAPLRVGGSAAHWYSLIDTAERGVDVRLDGVRVVGTLDAGMAAAWLLWHVNCAVIDASPQHVLLHAAGVVAQGRGIVLPGAAGSGKTTLAAGLVQRGLGYLSDEVVAIAADDMRLVPYPKALALEAGSIAALWGPGEVVAPEFPGAGKTHVVPDRVRPGAVAGPCPARMVVAPRYRPEGTTQLARLDASEALMELATNTVNLDRHGGGGLSRLAALAERVPCYRLEISNLNEACRLVVGEIDALDIVGEVDALDIVGEVDGFGAEPVAG